VTSCRRALLTLAVIAPVLTEIVSGNTPAHVLLNPRTAALLLLAYSLPLVVIRELALRWRLPVIGLFLLGLAYGLLNEGLVAQTLIRAEHVPIDRFDRYLVAGGFNLSWIVLIVPWHAFLAVMFPIALVSRAFPTCEHRYWLGSRVFLALTSLLIALVVFVAFARRPHAQMLACLAAMIILVWLASLVRHRAPRAASSRVLGHAPAFALGAVTYLVCVLSLILLAAFRVPALVYFGAAAAISLSLTALNRSRDLLRLPAGAHVALGAYFVVSAFNLAGGAVHHATEPLLTGGVLAAAFLALAFAWRDSRGAKGMRLWKT
jgi:hypothetical protein